MPKKITFGKQKASYTTIGASETGKRPGTCVNKTTNNIPNRCMRLGPKAKKTGAVTMHKTGTGYYRRPRKTTASAQTREVRGEKMPAKSSLKKYYNFRIR